MGTASGILSAFLYGAEIAIIGLVMRDNDILTTTVVQQFTSGILALLLALTTQPMPTAAQVITPEFIGAMAYVAVLSAAFGAVAQNTAQAHVSPSEAGLLCSLESVFCALFSVAFFGEVLTPRMALASRHFSPPSWQLSLATRAVAPQPTPLARSPPPTDQRPPQAGNPANLSNETVEE